MRDNWLSRFIACHSNLTTLYSTNTKKGVLIFVEMAIITLLLLCELAF